MTRALLTAEQKRSRARKRWKRWADNNREHLRKMQRDWKKKNPDKVIAANRRYAEAHPEKIKEKWQRHQARFPEKCAARTGRHRKRNPDKVRAWIRAYFQTPEGKAARVNGERRRRARKMGCDAPATAKEITALLKNATACCYCQVSFDDETRPTLEHVIPLARGGAHSLDNLAAACGNCNSKKGVRMPHEFTTGANVTCTAVGNFT